MERKKPRTKPKSRAAPQPPKALDRAAWIAAAWVALGRSGVEGVRVEPLAASLGVTKGSFYWHFADRGALLDALLEDWERRATAAVIVRVDASSDDPRERLRELVLFTTSVREAPDAEHAIRAWGAVDSAARKKLDRVDARREAYVTDLLIAAGLSPDVAAVRAHLVYLALIGEYSRVAHGGAHTSRDAWEELLRMTLDRPSPSASNA